MSAALALFFSGAAVWFFWTEYKHEQRNERIEIAEHDKRQRAAERPCGDRPALPHKPIRAAVGLFTSHMYFQLPGGPIKHIFVEGLQWGSDVLRTLDANEQDSYSPFAWLIGGMAVAVVIPWLGTLTGRALSHGRRSLRVRNWCYCCRPGEKLPPKEASDADSDSALGTYLHGSEPPRRSLKRAGTSCVSLM